MHLICIHHTIQYSLLSILNTWTDSFNFLTYTIVYREVIVIVQKIFSSKNPFWGTLKVVLVCVSMCSSIVWATERILKKFTKIICFESTNGYEKSVFFLVWQPTPILDQNTKIFAQICVTNRPWGPLWCGVQLNLLKWVYPLHVVIRKLYNNTVFVNFKLQRPNYNPCFD